MPSTSLSAVSQTASHRLDVAARWQDVRPLLRRSWYVWLVLAGLAIQVVTLWRVLDPVTSGGYPPLKDSLIFEYIGWYLAQGGRLYVDVWEVKPPLSFEVTALLALLADGNVPLYHTLVLAVTNAAVVGCAFVVGLMTHELTGDEAASVAAGLALFALPAFHWRAAYGFKPKYLVVLCGLLAVCLAIRDRPFLAGVVGAASVGFWQLGLVFPVLSLGVVAQRGSRRAVGRWLAGGALLTAAMLAPVVWWGAVDELLAEAVLTPLLVTNDGGTVLAQVGYAARLFGRTLPLVLLGAFGLLVGTRADPDRRWWLLPGAAWFALQVLALDLDYYPDLIPAFAFVGLGLGLVLGDAEATPYAVYGLVVSMVVVSVATLGPHAVGAPVELVDPSTVEAPYHGAERPTLLWHTLEPTTCRPFFGTTQAKVLDLTGGSLTDRHCGPLEPLWEAFVDRYWPVG